MFICGAATNVCVYATAIRDCVAGTSEELHQAFLKNIDYVIGDVISSEELIAGLN